MALPTLTTPKHDLILPSGKKVKIRPFLVKEQKLILHAIEMRDSNQLNNALDDVLRACTFNEVDIDKLPVYDIEYLTMQLRARSVGEIVEVNYICNNKIDNKLLNAEALKFDPNATEVRGPGICETKIPVKINIGSLECTSKTPRPDNRIMLTDTIGLVMRDLPYATFRELQALTSGSDAALRAMAACVDMVIDGDTIHSRIDLDDAELIDWLEQLTGEDFDKLDAYVKSMPTLNLSLNLTCPCCGAKDTLDLEGLDDFLA